MSTAEYRGLNRNAAALAGILEFRDELIADLERRLVAAEAALKWAFRYMPNIQHDELPYAEREHFDYALALVLAEPEEGE